MAMMAGLLILFRSPFSHVRACLALTAPQVSQIKALFRVKLIALLRFTFLPRVIAMLEVLY